MLFWYSRTNDAQLATEIEKTVHSKMGYLSGRVNDFSQDDLPAVEDEVKFIVYSKRGKVLFWNDNAYIPSFDYFPFRKSDNIISTENGEYLFQKKKGTWNGEDAYVAGLIPLRRSFKSSNSHLSDVYNTGIIRNNIKISNEPGSIPILYEGETLFSVESNGRSFYDEDINWLITILLFVFFSGVLMLGYHSAVWVKKRYSFSYSFYYLILLLGVVRTAMFLSVLPDSFGKLSVFVYGIFTYNWFYRTLGDSLINVVMINLIIFFSLAHGYKAIRSLARKWKLVVGSLLLISSYFSLFLFVKTIDLLSVHSQITLDIASSLDFSIDRVIAYILVSLMGLLFFQLHYLTYKVLSWSQFTKEDLRVLHLACGSIAFFLLIWQDDFLLAFSLNVIYIIGIYMFEMPHSLRSFKFESVNYILFTVVIVSIAGAFIIFKAFEKDQLNEMQKFATYLEVDRDFEGEYLLFDILEQVKEDAVVNSKMINPKVNEKSIENKIKRTYLSTYFNDYEIGITLFDKKGKGISRKNKGSSFNTRLKLFEDPKYQTGYENVFYDGRKDLNRRKRYICYSPLVRYGFVNGYIGIELKLKKVSSKRVLPQLLQDRSVKSRSSFDYSIFSKNDIVFKSGEFEYSAMFKLDWLENESLYGHGIDGAGYRHFAIKVGDATTVISAPVYKWRDVVSNFSFLFVIYLTVSCLLILIKYLTSLNKSSLNFSTKILVFSGASFVLPMLLVAVAVLSSTDSSYRKEIDKSNLKQTRLMAENLDDPFIELNERKMNREDFENQISTFASNASLDINVYDTKGMLMASSTPEIFESGIISKYINPSALKALLNSEKESLIMEESIGKFQYKTTYVTINSLEDASVLGFLAAPYFGSKNHLKRQQLIVFTNIIIIFTFVFIFSIGIAYYVISKITRPIIEIADRLHDTGFVQANQPIEWESDDEIGTLVHEYNNMLSKLESTKAELARNEKEAAWREMAKQVAHEIKNPLTPMKLTIQHLQRILEGDGRDKKSLDVLLNQIDTLDEIVTSFSHFAKMPTPVKEPFNILETLEKSLDLHVDKELNFKKEAGTYMVEGDKKLFGRIFNNLILNAFQSMKKVASPSIDVLIVNQSDKVLISFKDHGEGIGEDIKGKVFTPNFSTKETGSGIGLAVAKRGIEHAGGKIWFDSEVGVGTTFYVEMANSIIEEKG